ISSLIVSLLILSQAQEFSPSPTESKPTVCVIGSGIGSSSLAHFLRHYYNPEEAKRPRIQMFERNGVVGVRMATVNVVKESFEVGASILHPKNHHALNLQLKNLSWSKSKDSLSFGIWNGKKFILKTFNVNSENSLLQKMVSLANSLLIFVHYGFSILKIEDFVKSVVGKFLKYYESVESRPVFESVDGMLKWAGLYNFTKQSLLEELTDAGLSFSLIQELVIVITRINYGQSACMSGLAGAVSLAGSGGGLWSIDGGNINRSDVALHLHEEIKFISHLTEYYELNSTTGSTLKCEVTVISTPLDEENIQFTPPISIPERKLQHTHATFVRGLLDPMSIYLEAL
ncbi:LOW QUALITY PROTEIN: Prenylcys_lyase domain-containing protein/NAD_binding_8 domain-containing protein, partial [Cephalotus follicularis]